MSKLSARAGETALSKAQPKLGFSGTHVKSGCRHAGTCGLSVSPMGCRGTASSIHSLEQDALSGFVVINRRGDHDGMAGDSIPKSGNGAGAQRSCILPDSSCTYRLGQDLDRTVAIDTTWCMTWHIEP